MQILIANNFLYKLLNYTFNFTVGSLKKIINFFYIHVMKFCKKKGFILFCLCYLLFNCHIGMLKECDKQKKR